MKKILQIAIFLITSIATGYTQGISKLFGLVGGQPQANQSSNGFLFSADSTGQNLQLRYDFPVTTFGAKPLFVEMMPYNGKLYGTTSLGGLNNHGTIFEYDPVTDIYAKKFDFGPTVSATGSSPKGSLLLYNDKFYGLASESGANAHGCIFEWDPATNIYTKKFDFTGANGSRPQNSLKLMNGKMYGTTLSGGAVQGVVFEWDPITNIYTKILDLNGIGAGTNGRLFINNVTPYNNKLYCMPHQGGVNDYGTLLEIDPSQPIGANTTIIKQFDAANGITPNNNEMIVYNNKLYGILPNGGAGSVGTLFELNPVGNIFTKLADFNSTATGGSPIGKLVANGTKFLGLCNTGGTNGTGTIFEWDPINPTAIVKKKDFLPNNYDDPVNPYGTLTLFNSKFYTTTYESSFTNQGTLYEYDYAANTIIKKKTFNAAENGRIPYGKPVLLNGLLYGICYQGPQEIFGTPYGCLWQFNPSTSVYSRKFLFNNTASATNGRAPVSAPIAYNGKLYGTTNNGGISDLGILYEFDPVTEVYTKKDMQSIGGSFPVGEPAVYNNKLYGMTIANGVGNRGIVYSYDQATGVLSKLYDVQNGGSFTPNGAFTLYNNKLYGATSTGGANNQGGVFVYDPVTNTATTPASFSIASGINVSNAPTLYNNKLYMMANAGSAGGRGSIMQFDPTTNVLTNIYNFTIAVGGTGYDPTGGLTVNGSFMYAIIREFNDIKIIQLDPATNTVTTRSTYTPASTFNLPGVHNGLTVVPAFIANGVPNSCETYPTIVIDATNNNRWVPVLNTSGDVVAEIKANGNSLGNVSASTYINTNAVREDPLKRLYMDRSISIDVQNQPTSNVDIRLYIKTNEFLALKNATNSIGQPSGINTINDVAIFKNAQLCASSLTVNASRLTTTTEPYEYGYVLSASISSFSSFFFAKNTFSILPLQLLQFNANKKDNGVQVNWVATNENDILYYEVERSIDNNVFKKINTVAAKTNVASNSYTVKDDTPFNGANYYRLKIIAKENKVTYSQVVKIVFDDGANEISIAPNPAKNYINVSGYTNYTQLQIIDVNGRVLKQFNKSVNNRYSLHNLQRGLYFVKLINDAKTLSYRLVIDQ